MGGTTGKLTHLGLGKETIFGTGVGSSLYLPYNSESLTNTIEELIEASIKARRDEGDSLEGLGTVAGDTVHEIHPAGIGHLLRSALGAPVSMDNTGSYTHIYTPLAGRARATGTAIAGTGATVIVVTGTPYVASEHVGRWAHIISGSAAGQTVPITANTTSQLSVATSPAAASGDTFEILDGPEHSVLPSYSIECHRDLVGATAAFRYSGCVVNNLSLTIGVGAKILVATSSWLGKSVANIAATTPTLPTTSPFTWDQMILGVGLANSGTGSGGSSTTLVDTGIGWTVNAYAGYLVYITGGTGINQIRKITSNTIDTLTVSDAFITTPDATSTYKIFYANNLTETITWAWTNGLVAVPTLNNTKTIYKIESDAFRSGTISKTVIPEDTIDYSTYYTGWTTREWLLYFKGATITGDHDYSLGFYFPKVLFTAYPINVGGGGRITVAAGLKIKYDATSGYFMKCILQNNTSQY